MNATQNNLTKTLPRTIGFIPTPANLQRMAEQKERHGTSWTNIVNRALSAYFERGTPTEPKEGA
jgi:hypothetical protein